MTQITDICLIKDYSKKMEERFVISENVTTAEFLESFKISLFEPFSDFLMGTEREKSFQLSLLDVVRFAGHACPSMIGAFLIARTAIESLYPDTKIGVRGEIEIDLPTSATERASGPMANVFSYITGAWAETGFGGFQNGDFVRRNLLRFNSVNVPAGVFRFTRRDTGVHVDISYQPGAVQVYIDSSMPFQLQWRYKIRAILENVGQAVIVL